MSGCEGSDFSIEYRTGTQYSLLPKESHWRKCEVTINETGKKTVFKKLHFFIFYLPKRLVFFFFFCIRLVEN